MKERLDYVDQMRGFAILLVCMGHIFGPHTTLGNLHPCFEIISSFHMSFFFFISGYLNHKTHAVNVKGMKNYLKKKFYALILPYWFWLYIAAFFLCNKYPASLSEVISLLNFYPNSHYWFLPCLFLAMLLWLIEYAVFERHMNLKGYKLAVAYCIAPIALVCIGMIFHLFFFLIYAIYMGAFLFGDYLSRSEKLKTFVLKDSMMGGVVLAMCIVWKLYSPEGDGGGTKTISLLILILLSSLCACLFFYNFFRKIDLPERVKGQLMNWGRFSLVIYLVPLPLLPSSFVFPPEWSHTVVNLSVLFLATNQCVIASFLGKILFKIPWLNFIMFGKR